MPTWSGIRNKLEDDYLCPALREHIRYYAVSCSKSDGHEGRAAILLDGVEILRSNYYADTEKYWTRYQETKESTPCGRLSAKTLPACPYGRPERRML